ncbi:hypothetical protein IFM89_022204 [Coptis chinensis]|uniref:F-box domain-containing protein n=1 Tax=Coptis chinensis TaxID=261450 RepID=A0A835HU57_9MAGN|nr:hypothetical protein IFM89_022204 [Coptis chinensis]
MTSETVQVTARFSFLPEGIRDHILSFLPMEDVVKTSVLSRQWRHICYSLYDLEFNQQEFENMEGKDRNAVDFRNFVDRLLISHDSTSSPPDLKVLKLCEVVESNSSNIHISSPNLEEMEYIAPKPPNVSSETLSSLVRVVFILIEKPSVPGNIVTKMLMGLRNVVKLSLSTTSFEVLGEDPNLAACLPTSCRSLRHLCLMMRPFKDSIRVLILLLRSYPRLETLDISFQMDSKLESISSEQSGELFNAYILKHLTGNLLKHLKAVKIKKFRIEDEDEYRIVRYILENANFFKKMSILYHPSVEEDVKFRMLVVEFVDI